MAGTRLRRRMTRWFRLARFLAAAADPTVAETPWTGISSTTGMSGGERHAISRPALVAIRAHQIVLMPRYS